jgi:selenocysteine-specific elongation factor
MIVGTAGHIDHGKTSLVKALTGVDTDRLQEEKERGITVDLGFAYRSYRAESDPDAAGEHVLGFVDVPGHEKLVRNMLAGATGIDHVLLVVAADDGPMPQTLEHVAILDLLGLERGVVALTKTDLVSPERAKAVREEVRRMLAPTALAGAPILPVSTVNREGIDALQAHLAQAASELGMRDNTARGRGNFRLAVDRSFSLAGIGTVVTGTAVAGRVHVGDRLLVSPRGAEVRVRGIHAQNQRAESGAAGQRLALNLAGVEKHDVRRGDWIVAEAAHAPTQRIDARLRVLGSEAKPLAHWTPVHLHLGAVDVGARVVGLEGAAVAPGSSAIVQLHLDRPIGALRGDRFVLRDQSALRTIAGGSVIDPFVPESRRRKAQRLTALRALEQPTPDAALRELLAQQAAGGVEQHGFTTLWNLDAAQTKALLDAVPHRSMHDDKVALLFEAAHVDRYAHALTEHLRAFHAKSPDSPGLTAEQLQRGVKDRPAGKVFAALLRELVSAGTLQRSGAQLHLPGHQATLQGLEKQLWERLEPWLDEGGIAPPKLSDMLERDKSLRKDQVMRTLQRLERMGKVHAVGAEYFIKTKHVLELALVSERLAKADPNQRLNVKDLRDATGMSRHLSVPLVEFFDGIGFTKRDAVGRHVKRDARKMFGDG